MSTISAFGVAKVNACCFVHASGFAFLFHIDPETPSQLKGDPLRLKQVLINLINNALKFFTGTEVLIETEEKEKEVRLIISNQGENIPEQKLRKITEAFGMADQHMDKNAGLGLSIVNACQELVKGNLRIESLDNTIRVTLSFRKA